MMGALTGCGKTKDVEQSQKKSVNKEVVETMDVEVEDTEEVSIEVTTEASVNVQTPECELLSVTYDDVFSSSQDEINKRQYGEADYVVFTTDFTVPADYTDGPFNAGRHMWTTSGFLP